MASIHIVTDDYYISFVNWNIPYNGCENAFRYWFRISSWTSIFLAVLSQLPLGQYPTLDKIVSVFAASVLLQF